MSDETESSSESSNQMTKDKSVESMYVSCIMHNNLFGLNMDMLHVILWFHFETKSYVRKNTN